jgi:hypothetical protein
MLLAQFSSCAANMPNAADTWSLKTPVDSQGYRLRPSAIQ